MKKKNMGNYSLGSNTGPLTYEAIAMTATLRKLVWEMPQFSSVFEQMQYVVAFLLQATNWCQYLDTENVDTKSTTWMTLNQVIHTLYT